jgi:TrmH family RNA methyltransferase
MAADEHPDIRVAAACHDRRGREEHGCFLVEGRRAVGDFLAAGWRPRRRFLPRDQPVPAGWEDAVPVSERALRRLSAQSTPSGWAALFPLPEPARPAGGLVLVGIQDPGNAGTLIRAAAAFAWPGVVLVGGADPWAPKTVQASAGALARIPVLRLPGDQPPGELLDGPAAALVVRDGAPPEALAPPRWLLVGGEGDGLPEAWAAAAARCTLPMPGGTESLNAAMAGTLALYLLRPRG